MSNHLEQFLKKQFILLVVRQTILKYAHVGHIRMRWTNLAAHMSTNSKVLCYCQVAPSHSIPRVRHGAASRKANNVCETKHTFNMLRLCGANAEAHHHTPSHYHPTLEACVFDQSRFAHTQTCNAVCAIHWEAMLILRLTFGACALDFCRSVNFLYSDAPVPNGRAWKSCHLHT